MNAHVRIESLYPLNRAQRLSRALAGFAAWFRASLPHIVACAAICGAVVMTALFHGAPIEQWATLHFVAWPVTAVVMCIADALSPFSLMASLNTKQSKPARALFGLFCAGTVALSFTSTYGTMSRVFVAPLKEASAASEQLTSIQAEIKALEAKSAAASTPAAQTNPLTTMVEAARVSEAAAREALTRAENAEATALRARDAKTACDGGRHAPIASRNPRCASLTDAHAAAVAKTATASAALTAATTRLANAENAAVAAISGQATATATSTASLADLRTKERAATATAAASSSPFSSIALAEMFATVAGLIIAIGGTAALQIAKASQPAPSRTRAASRVLAENTGRAMSAAPSAQPLTSRAEPEPKVSQSVALVRSAYEAVSEGEIVPWKSLDAYQRGVLLGEARRLMALGVSQKRAASLVAVAEATLRRELQGWKPDAADRQKAVAGEMV